jgi:ribonucleases P/MRP protein subunit RPP40
MVYPDYRKAFDTVPHCRLIWKMRKYGINEKFVKWIKSFLIGRKMRVTINGRESIWLEVISGVPQGSILGPLLFLLFVNDVPDWILCSIKMFADNTKYGRA